jgi:hypothetical protein
MNRKHEMVAKQEVARWLSRRDWQNPSDKAAYVIGHFALDKPPETPVEFRWEPPSHTIRYEPNGSWVLRLGLGVSKEAEILYLIERLQNDGGLKGSLSLCPNCKQTWYVRRPNKKVCSDACRVSKWEKKQGKRWRKKKAKSMREHRAKMQREWEADQKKSGRTVKRGPRSFKLGEE